MRVNFVMVLIAAVGAVGFIHWHSQRPAAASAGPSEGSFMSRLFSSSSVPPYNGPRRSFKSLEEMSDYQSAHLEKFRAHVGREENGATLREVAYFSSGENMDPTSGGGPVTCNTTGYYYVTERPVTLSCGKHYTEKLFEFCGGSPTWDRKQ